MPLEIQQQDVTLQGHAIQCRINAEDPKEQLPALHRHHHRLSFSAAVSACASTERSTRTTRCLPTMTPSWRNSPCAGRTWEETVSRMRRSLEEYVFRGRENDNPVYERNHAGSGLYGRTLRYLLPGNPSRPVQLSMNSSSRKIWFWPSPPPSRPTKGCNALSTALILKIHLTSWRQNAPHRNRPPRSARRHRPLHAFKIETGPADRN